jgi:hypothetical protein
MKFIQQQMLCLLLSLVFVPCVLCFGVYTTKKPATTILRNASIENRRTFVSTLSIATGLLLPTFTTTSSPYAWAVESSPFEGTYTDPINHPGGTRTIKLLKGLKTGDYQLAEIQGGGGVGEPMNYVLPAVIIDDKSILIDFSSKGGPKDFVGVLSKEGDLLFKLDGNKWPRVK